MPWALEKFSSDITSLTVRVQVAQLIEVSIYCLRTEYRISSSSSPPSIVVVLLCCVTSILFFFTLFRIKCSQLAYDPNRFSSVVFFSISSFILNFICVYLAIGWHESRINVNVSIRYTRIPVVHSTPAHEFRRKVADHVWFDGDRHRRRRRRPVAAARPSNRYYYCYMVDDARAPSPADRNTYHHFQINQFTSQVQNNSS